jgi:hypothetical protein
MSALCIIGIITAFVVGMGIALAFFAGAGRNKDEGKSPQTPPSNLPIEYHEQAIYAAKVAKGKEELILAKKVIDNRRDQRICARKVGHVWRTLNSGGVINDTQYRVCGVCGRHEERRRAWGDQEHGPWRWTQRPR